jgi:hypothetical protein
MGRIDDLSASSCLPSRFLRILSAIYVACVMSFTFFLLSPSHDPTLLAFMLSVSLATVSLGVAIWAWFPRGIRSSAAGSL